MAGKQKNIELPHWFIQVKNGIPYYRIKVRDEDGKIVDDNVINKAFSRNVFDKKISRFFGSPHSNDFIFSKFMENIVSYNNISLIITAPNAAATFTVIVVYNFIVLYNNI